MLSASLSLLVINSLLSAVIPILNLIILAMVIVAFLYALQSACGSFFIFESPRYRHFSHVRVDSDPCIHVHGHPGRGWGLWGWGHHRGEPHIHVHGRHDESRVHGRHDESRVHGRHDESRVHGR